MIKNIVRTGLFLALVGCGQASGARPPGFQGVLEFDEREAAFEVGGRVRELSVRRGQSLTAGAPVATLDDTLARPLR